LSFRLAFNLTPPLQKGGYSLALMRRKTWLLFLAFPLIPTLTPSQTVSRAVSVPLPLPISSVAAGNDAIRYVGAAAVTRPGEDLGAQINAAYASLPASGGTIVVIADPSGRCYSFSTPIVANVPGKYLLLEGGSIGVGSARASTAPACLDYAPTAGTAITLDYVPSGSGSGGAVMHGLQNLTLKNNACETIGGCGSNAVGILFGGANGGAQGAAFGGLRVFGFGYGINVMRSEPRGGELAFRDCAISYNSTGVLDTNGDAEHLSFDACHFEGNGIGITSAASVRISNSSIGSNSVLGVGCSAPAACDLNDDHFENGSADTTHFLDGNGIFFISGGDMRDDGVVGNTDWWMHFAGPSFLMVGTILASGGRTVSDVIVNQGPGVTALQIENPAVLTNLYSNPLQISELGLYSGRQSPPQGPVAINQSGTVNLVTQTDGSRPPGASDAEANKVMPSDAVPSQPATANDIVPTTTSNLNSILFVDGTKYKSIQAAVDALDGKPGWVIVPPGKYVSTSPIVLKNDNQHLQCAGIGATLIQYSGGTTPAIIDIGTSITGSPSYSNISINGCSIAGNSNVQYGIRTRGVWRSDFSHNQVYNVVDAGIMTNFCVRCVIDDWHTSINEIAMTVVPNSCIILDGPDGSHETTVTVPKDVVCEGVRGDGVKFGFASKDGLDHGTSEGNGRGAYVSENAVGTQIRGTDFEANTNADIVDYGSHTEVDGAACSSGTRLHVGPKATTLVIGDTCPATAVDAGGVWTLIQDQSVATGTDHATMVLDTGIQTLSDKTIDTALRNILKVQGTPLTSVSGQGSLCMTVGCHLTTPTIEGASVGTGVQGTDSKLLTSGSVSGSAGTPLCLDANGGATTNGCGASLVQVTRSGPSCTTGNNSYDSCGNVLTWPNPFKDANYSVTCSGIGPSNPRANLTVAARSASSVIVNVVTYGSVGVRFSEIDCTGVGNDASAKAASSTPPSTTSPPQTPLPPKGPVGPRQPIREPY
jgi:hypothetical protein